MKKTEDPIVVEQSFNRSLADLWDAISDGSVMPKWFFNDIPEFRPEVGFRTRFDVDAGERIFPHVWEVTEVVPQERLVYTWEYDGYDGKALAIFEVFGDDANSRIKLTYDVTEDFPDEIPEFKREAGLGGWTYFIKERLKEFLDGISA